MEESKRLEAAKRRVQAMEGFYIHAVVYVLVIGILFAINLTLTETWWVHWPAMGWALGLIGHGIAVFGGAPARLQAWRERKIREIAGQIR